MSDLEQLVAKAMAAANGGFDVLSTGEKVAAALILNRSDWLAEMGYSMAEAIDRIGPEWSSLVPTAARLVLAADAVVRKAEKTAREECTLADLAPSDEEIDVTGSLVNCWMSPGYRSASFVFDVRRLRSNDSRRLCIHVGADDTEAIAKHLIEVHQHAWQRGEPLDIKQGERRPPWIDGR